MIDRLRLAKRTRYFTPPVIEANNEIDSELIDFSIGNPEQAFFPVDAITEAFKVATVKYKEDALQYKATIGLEILRDIIATVLMQQVNVETTTEEIAMISGAQQGIELAAKIFIDENDIIFCEEPTFPVALQTFSHYKAKCIGIPTDENGMIISQLENMLDKYPQAKFIYSIPDFQNPTGTLMSIERRKQLAHLAATYNIPVIEDAPYSRITFYEQSYPAIKSFDQAGLVVYLGSFSKILVPGLRVGWICADKRLLEKFVIAKQYADLQTSTLAQHILIALLEEFSIEEHIEMLRKKYNKRQRAMLQALKQYFHPYIQYTIPKGGFFIWVELPHNVDTTELLTKTIAKANVSFVPGEFFSTKKRTSFFLRLSYASTPVEKIATGIERLAKEIEHAIAANK